MGLAESVDDAERRTGISGAPQLSAIEREVLVSIPGGLTINTLLPLSVVGTRGVQTCRGGARPDINTFIPVAPK